MISFSIRTLVVQNSLRQVNKHTGRHVNRILFTPISRNRNNRLLFGSLNTNTMASQNELGESFEQKNQESFFEDLYKLIESHRQTPNRPIVQFKHPKELEEILQLDIKQQPLEQSKLLQQCKKVLQYSVQTDHRHFYNQLYAGRDLYGLGASWLTEALNTNQHTFEVAPVFVLVERYIVKKINSFTGYNNGDGVFVPGGSFANIMALYLARATKAPDTKHCGMAGTKPLVVYCSDQAHYSVTKGASFTGLGSDNIVRIESDAMGRMKPDKLKAAVELSISQGHRPLLVWATAGTTVLGAYDDINALADVSEKHDMWLHVDGAWGGSVMLSKKHKHLLAGIERSQSFVWNSHKVGGTPLQCTALLTSQQGVLDAANASNAAYLFQPDKFYDVSYDRGNRLLLMTTTPFQRSGGDKTIQCGRKPDAFKLWLLWSAHGDSGMENMVDRLFENAKYIDNKMRNTAGFRLVINEQSCTNICFWYIPPRLRNQTEDDDWWKEVSEVAPKIKERMTMQGTMMIGFTPLPSKNFVNFFRLVLSNSMLVKADMDFVVAEIQRLGHDL